MPLWPFLMLVAIFIAVLVLPPLLAAWVDYRNEERRWPTSYNPGATGRHQEAEANSAAGDSHYTLDPSAGTGPVQQDPGELSHPLPPEEIIGPGEAAGKGANQDPVAGYSARDPETGGRAETRRREK